MRALKTLLGPNRISFARLGIGLALLLIALVLVLAALAQLIEALELALLTTVTPPALASLLAGVILLLVAGIIVVVGRLCLRRRKAVSQAAASGSGIEAIAQIATLIRRHPGQAALLASIAGFVLGVLPELGSRADASSRRRTPERPEPPAGP